MLSKELLKRVAQAARDKKEEFSIVNENIDEIPAELFNIISLKKLFLSQNKLTSLPDEIGNLKNLKVLDLSGNQLVSISKEIASLKKLRKIHLNGNSLSVIPKELGELRNLSVLELAGNKLTELPDELSGLIQLTQLDLIGIRFEVFPVVITKLTNLQKLDMDNCGLKELPPEISELRKLKYLSLYINELSDLPSTLSQIQSLVHLNLGTNRFTVIPNSILKLKNLEILTIDENSISEIPDEISQLQSLFQLNISSNRLKTIPPKLCEMTNLIYLELGADHDRGSNQISILPKEIGQLTNLAELDLYGNSIKFLPHEIKFLKQLKELDLQANLLPIPPEILEKTKEPQAILSYYFSVIDKQKKPINEIKLLVIGQGSVGKTTLIQYIMSGFYTQNITKTEGISISQWQVDNQLRIEDQQSSINLNIWDFGGQEIMHATHQFFLTKRSLYLLVLDSRLTQEENRVEYWLKIIQSFGGESPVLIVGNKIDQHPLDIDRTGLQKKYPNIVGILETSAATGAGIEALKSAITEEVNNLPHVRDLLPETWFTVKTKLEELGRQSNFITHDKYLELCAENEVSDETSQRTLIGFLHDLGVVLHFQDDPRLEALGILNPQWVTNGVYKILNSHTLFQNKGALTVSMLDEILNLPEYPRGKRLFIVDMMKKFELCYDIELDKTFLVPDLLPKDEPAELKFNGVPAFEYAYPVLPSSVITRFIVRMNQKIEDGLVWRTGVVLKIGENKALVKADVEDRKITIAIDGLEHTRRDALSVIRYQLDEIHGSIKGLNPEKYVPVPGAQDADPLEYETLLMMEREGIETTHVKSGRKLVAVNVSQMLNGVESEYQRKQYGNVINISGNITDSTIIAGDENEVNKK